MEASGETTRATSEFSEAEIEKEQPQRQQQQQDVDSEELTADLVPEKDCAPVQVSCGAPVASSSPPSLSPPPSPSIVQITPPPAPQDNGSSKASSISQSAKSKLRSATRALLFFRSSARRRQTLSSSNSQANHLAESLDLYSLSARLTGRGARNVGVRRQETTDSLPANNNNNNSSNNNGRRGRHQLSHSQSSMSSFSTPGAATTTSVIQSTTTTIQSPANEVPQFIVPKMNALKLPIVCRVRSLEGELMREVFVHRYELGQYLIESLKVSVGIRDSKYFGLKMAKSVEDQEDLRQPWLDLNESVCKQIKQNGFQAQLVASGNTNGGQSSARSVDFYLRVKYYPPNLTRIQDSFLRQYLWLQLRRDLRLGKLTSSMNNLTLLMACILQHELGDYKPELVDKLPEWNILPNQDLIEEQALIVWRTRLMGAKKHQVQMQFLRAAVILETYGFDYYPVRDHQRQRAYLLGFNYAGIKTIRNGRIVHHFRWHSLSKIAYERRMIIFHIYPTENSKRKQILGFKCLSNDDCQGLYMRLLEQKYFFTVDLAYFDKSVRRPSYLHSSLDAQQLEDDEMEDEENFVVSEEEQAMGQQQDGHMPAASSQHQLSDGLGSFDADNCTDCSGSRSPPQGDCGQSQANYLRKSSSVQEPMESQIYQPQYQESTRRTRAAPMLVRQAACQSPAQKQVDCCYATERCYCVHCSPPPTSLPPTSVGGDNVVCLEQNCQAPKQIGFLQAATITGTSLAEAVSLWSSFFLNCMPYGLTGQRLMSVAKSVDSETRPQSDTMETNSSHEPNNNGANNNHDNNHDHVLSVNAIKLLLVILVMNFILRLTDSLSSLLIEVLSLPSGSERRPDDEEPLL